MEQESRTALRTKFFNWYYNNAGEAVNTLPEDIFNFLFSAMETDSHERVEALEKENKELKEWNKTKQAELNQNAVSVAIAESEQELMMQINELADKLEKYELVAAGLPFAREKIERLESNLSTLEEVTDSLYQALHNTGLKWPNIKEALEKYNSLKQKV